MFRLFCFGVVNSGSPMWQVTELIYKRTTEISEYKICNALPEIDVSKPGTYNVGTASTPFLVEIFHNTEDHVGLLRQVVVTLTVVAFHSHTPIQRLTASEMFT